MAATTVQIEADLSLSLAASPDPAQSGQNLAYTLLVNNAGPNEASDVEVTVNLPPEVVFQDASGSGWACSESGGTVTCTRSSLAVGDAPAINVMVMAPATISPLAISSSASVSASSIDPDAGNDSDDLDVTVTPFEIFLPLVVK